MSLSNGTDGKSLPMSFESGANEIHASPGVFIAPLSFAQQRLWFLSQLHPGNCAYNVPFGLRLCGPLHVGALRRALAYLVNRHESLRTTFQEIKGVPHQVIAPEAAVSMEVCDESQMAGADLNELRALEANRPFDLERGPLIRFRLCALAREEHVLLLTLHHTVSDGWSAGVLVRELFQAYEMLAQDRVPELPELPIQYADFANWQHEHFTGKILRDELRFWKTNLQDAPRLLELPIEFARPKELTFAGATETISLDESLVGKIQELCRTERATPFMFYTACFNALLGRYTGQTDIVLGTPTANRDRTELENLVGFVANTVLLRTRFSLEASFQDLFATVRASSLEALAHQQLPFDKLVEELHPARSPSHNPLFQVLIGMYDNPAGRQSAGNLAVEVLDPLVTTSKFDLSLYIVEGNGPITMKLEYNTALFSRDYAQRLLAHLQQIITAAIQNPAIAIRKLPLLSGSEKALILHSWNGTAAPMPETTLHALVEQQCARTPDEPALVFEGRIVSYADLNRLANQLAHSLRERGASPNTFVGVCMERSCEMVVALLGILKAGAAYVPIDPTYPSERLEFMIEDAKVPVLITQSHLRSKLVSFQGAVLCLDVADNHASLPATNPPTVNTPDDLAYCIYTSGSTGRPKGAMNTHRGICNRLLWGQNTYPISSRDKVLQKTPFSFDVSVWEFFWPLITGATLVIARPEGHKDPAYLVDLINRELITTIHFVPSMLQAFLNEPSAKTCRSIRKTICSGEALPMEVQEQFFDLLDAQLLNFYGPTESSVEATYWECQRGSHLGFVPIGKPIANTQIYILNDAMEAVPILVPGEIYIGGVGVARGYHDRPGLTAEKFLPDPFRPGNRLYRTGDLARFLPDGTIQYLGRIDHQVKIRGFRIELEEIESVLRQHPLVREAVVVSKTINSQPHLVGYFVGYSSVTIEIDSLRAFLKTRLPEYMVPGFFVALRQIPLSPNGKADRKALPDPELDRIQSEAGYISPRNETEEILAQIWCEVLRVERAGVHDNFFDLGGHSLLATQLISRIKSNFNAQISLSRFFEVPTIAQLGKEIRHARRDSERPGEFPESPGLLRRIESLSASEIDDLLQKELN